MTGSTARRLTGRSGSTMRAAWTACAAMLLVLSAYAITRALESGQTRWLALTGTLLGFGFLTKMLQAFLVLPVFALVYLIAGPPRLGRRIWQLLVGGAAVVVAAGWWVAIVMLASSPARITGRLQRNGPGTHPRPVREARVRTQDPLLRGAEPGQLRRRDRRRGADYRLGAEAFHQPDHRRHHRLQPDQPSLVVTSPAQARATAPWQVRPGVTVMLALPGGYVRSRRIASADSPALLRKPTAGLSAMSSA